MNNRLNVNETGRKSIIDDVESWQIALQATDIVGLVYRLNDQNWYLDRRIKGCAQTIRTFGRIGLLADEYGAIEVPPEIVEQFVEPSENLAALRIQTKADQQ